MQAAHDEAKWVALIEVILKLFKGVAGLLTSTAKLNQLLEEFVVVELKKFFKMVFSLLRRSGRTEEVCKFNSKSSQFGVLKINNDHISWISSVFIRVSGKKENK